MPVIETNLGDVKEPRPVPRARYGLTISEAEHNEEKNYVRVSIGIDGHLDAPNITHILSLDDPDNDPGKEEFKKLMRKRFLVAFSIPHDDTGFNTDDFAGATSEMEVTVTSADDDDQGRTFNRLILPKLPEDEADAPAPKAAAAPKRSSKPAPKRR